MIKLKFIHITKTGGTAIEDLAQKHKINWGRFDSSLTDVPSGTEFWHYPIGLYQPMINKLKEYHLFTIVRNPYTRCVSEYFCRWGGPQPNHMNKEQLNRYIVSNLNKLKQNPQMFPKGGHFLPQHYYTHDKKGSKIIQHILKFEDLPHNFDSLMEQYGLPIRLDQRINVSQKNLSVDDLSTETKKLIQEVYKKDFQLFGYQM